MLLILGVTITAVLILPFVLFGLYWLFVVNGPTPVVKARIDTVTQSTDIVSQNNVVLDSRFGHKKNPASVDFSPDNLFRISAIASYVLLGFNSGTRWEKI